MRIGIYAPYDRSETTSLALRLATEASDLATSVSWLAPGRISRRVDSDWDTRVSSAYRQGIDEWGVRQEQIIWFDRRPELAHSISLKNPKVQHCLVPSWHGVRKTDFPAQSEPYHSVVFSSYQANAVASLLQREQKLPRSHNFFGLRWATGFRLQSVRRLVTAERQSVCVVCPSFTIDLLGGWVIYLIDRLLKEQSTLNVKLLSEKTWPSPLRNSLDELCAKSGGRLTRVDRPTRQERFCALAYQDCVVDLALRRESGLALSDYLALAIPVIAFDLPPATELLQGSCRDLLLPCNLGLSWFGAPQALVDLELVLQRLPRLLTPHTLNSAQVGILADRTRLEPRRMFTNFWRAQWGLPAVDDTLQIPGCPGSV